MPEAKFNYTYNKIVVKLRTKINLHRIIQRGCWKFNSPLFLILNDRTVVSDELSHPEF